jgi:hypothetical protein
MWMFYIIFIRLIIEPRNSCDNSWIFLSLSWDLSYINNVRTWKCHCRTGYFIRKTMILVIQLVFQKRITCIKKLLLTQNYKETFEVFMEFFQVITTGVSEGSLSHDTWGSPCISGKFVMNLDSLSACTVCVTRILYCDGIWQFARQRLTIFRCNGYKRLKKTRTVRFSRSL